MSEDGEMWAEIKEERRQKRWDNRDQSLAYLKQQGIEVEELDAGTAHYRKGSVSFWPTTGKFFDTKTKQTGRGVKNFIKYIKQTKCSN